MKKILVTILTVAMLTSTVAAFADGAPMGEPVGGPMGSQPPRMEQGQQPPKKPADAPEKPSGEKPGDAPEEPEYLTGERPEMPSGEEPADAPEKPSGEEAQAQTDAKRTDDQQSTDGQQAPKMIDFDAMVTVGVISQETRDAIKAYMDEHKPEGEMPTAPAEGETPGHGEPNLLNDLLSAGVITQTEYDTLSAAA